MQTEERRMKLEMYKRVTQGCSTDILKLVTNKKPTP